MRQFILSVIRNVRRNPLITIINFLGLVLGFVCVIFITFWTRNELSYDRFHRNSKIIYRVHRYWYDANGAESLHLPFVAPPIAPLLIKEVPEIKEIARVYYLDLVLSSGDRKIAEENIGMAEPSLLKIFDFDGLPADNNLLIAPFTAIISYETALKYFNSRDVVGKFLEFKENNGKNYSLQITGVFKDWKGNSHFNPNILISFSTAESFFGKGELDDWGSNNYETFCLIPFMPPDIDKKLDSFIDQYLNNGSRGTRIRLEGLTDIHFNWYGNRSYVYILISIALLILIIGSINYMNLNAAIYFRRLKEIKIKKIIGASQKSLTVNLLSESVLFCFIALLLAVFIASIGSGFIKISENPLEFKIKENISLIAGFIILSVLTGIFSGIYPVLILSSFGPVTTDISEYLKSGKAIFRNALVVFQFVVSIGLIICFLIVSRQLNYINAIELGLDKDNIIIIPAPPKLREKLEVFKEQLATNSNILAVCGSKRVPSEGLLDSNGANIVSEGNAAPLGFRLANVRIDRDFIPTYKIQLIAGRNFNENITADSGYILNEIAVSKIGWQSPEKALGQIIDYGGHRGSVIGVVKDFHYESLHTRINPVIMFYDPSSFNCISIRINPNDLNKTIAFIEKIWQHYNASDYIFTYDFLNDRFERLYKSEEKMRTVFSYFMIVAISISILGMLGLSVFLIERRTKEIGIRKINGARVSEVMMMLNFIFVKWVGAAFILAVPIAYYAMHRWLQGFAYKTDLSWWIFVIAGILAMAIALLTVSWQSWRAASGNPAETLRCD